MSTTLRPSHGVMEGKGAYNKHSKLQAGGAALGLPFLEKAVQSIEQDTEGHRRRYRWLLCRVRV